MNMQMKRPPGREGKQVLTLYLDPSVLNRFRQLALDCGTSTQTLAEEAIEFIATNRNKPEPDPDDVASFARRLLATANLSPEEKQREMDVCLDNIMAADCPALRELQEALRRDREKEKAPPRKGNRQGL
jgi:hypothetical protein